MQSNNVALRVGSLLEVRANAGFTSPADVDRLLDAFDAEVAKLPPPPRHTTVIDWRCCPVMSPSAAERLVFRMSRTNPYTVRSAALASEDSQTAVLQFVRLVREAGLPDRKLFFDADELVAWLAEVLTPAETERLRDFLRESATPKFAGGRQEVHGRSVGPKDFRRRKAEVE